MIDNTDDKDIELMFAEARRYDLLTAEQEQQIDAAKWQAGSRATCAHCQRRRIVPVLGHFLRSMPNQSASDTTFSESRFTLCPAQGAFGSVP